MERAAFLRPSPGVIPVKSSIKRCALYTRKSSEEGLDQAFNSLDAQREACEAYVKSQRSEGWRASPALYDDGGISGATMERPALKRLLSDIAQGKVDVVVVYKIDRLTRSLADFARMVELFDRHEVSFVSVTQSFNTTSSMGRLTLNVLLSFAQFEREVTGERIRDKIAASKAKGMWMGGLLPLGYDAPQANERALVVNSDEAVTVRRIFSSYLKLGSVSAVERELDGAGVRSRRRVTKMGIKLGPARFSRGALFHMLKNRIYLGLIVHRDKVYPGLHEAIVDEDVFNAVQAHLEANARRRGAARRQVERAPLTGIIFDADGGVLTPTFSRGARGKLYRYYVAAAIQRGTNSGPEADGVHRIAAAPLERALTEILERCLPTRNNDVLGCLRRVEIHGDTVQVCLDSRHLHAIESRLIENEIAKIDPVDQSHLRLTIPLAMPVHGAHLRINTGQQMGPSPDAVLTRALRAAHELVAFDRAGLPIIQMAPISPHGRQIIRLALLAPDVQRAILEGSQPVGLKVSDLTSRDLPLCWKQQAKVLGFPSPI